MRPESVVFFIDRSLGKRTVPEALRQLGASVEVHDDHFARDAEDSEWITEVAQRGWIILTKDQRIRHRPLERAAVRDAGARMFVLTGGNLSGPRIARVLERHLQKMIRISAGRPPPFIARVSASGIVVETLRG